VASSSGLSFHRVRIRQTSPLMGQPAESFLFELDGQRIDHIVSYRLESDVRDVNRLTLTVMVDGVDVDAGLELIPEVEKRAARSRASGRSGQGRGRRRVGR
jgi:hypothetical protein